MSQTSLGPGGARRLLKRLRDLMAGGGSAQERLNQTVRIIAGDMVAEVCSIYMARPGDVLELVATEGLKQEAVHKTRLAIGEGLVGDIAAHARPLALADAQAHPLFAYKPETGEESFHSLMGVPVLRGGRVLGVLAAKRRPPERTWWAQTIDQGRAAGEAFEASAADVSRQGVETGTVCGHIAGLPEGIGARLVPADPRATVAAQYAAGLTGHLPAARPVYVREPDATPMRPVGG